MKKILLVVIATAVTLFAASSTASATGGGQYPPQRPQVAPGRAVVAPRTTVGIFASRFCAHQPIRITISKRGVPTLVKSTWTNGQGKAAVYIQRSQRGTYTIKASACGKTAFSSLTVKRVNRPNLVGDESDDAASAFSALYLGMDARTAAVNGASNRSPVSVLESGSDDNLAVMQVALVGLMVAAALGSVTVVRRRSRTVV